MKKLYAFGLLLLLWGTAQAVGQVRAENQWILGTWQGTDAGNNVFEFAFHADGTGRSGGVDIVYSLEGNQLSIFSQTGTALRTSITVYRINDQRVIFYFRAAGAEWYVNLQRTTPPSP